MKYRSKPGAYGTLYLWAVDYTDVPGGDHIGAWHTWAYNAEGAWDNWHDSNEDMGYGTTGEFRRVPDRS